MILSRQGCGRATGYAEANKIVTWEGCTHVAWLDSPPEGFRVRVRTLDRAKGSWSPTYTVGEAHDNHGGPAVTVDSKGYLHIVYFPHHHPMRYRRSHRPNDASHWGEEIQLGERLTYPTLVCGPDDTLYLTARRSFPDRPWCVELWRKPAGAAWRRETELLTARYPGYAHFQESLAWGPDRRTLHLCCRFHEKSDREAYGRIQTVAYLTSPDGGRTWARRDGRPVALPATAETADVLACGGVDAGRVLRAGAIGVSPQGEPRLVYSVAEEGRAELLLARPGGGAVWDRLPLSTYIPPGWEGWNLTAPAGVTFTQSGRLIVAAQIQRPGESESGWGHASNEVVAFRADEAETSFTFRLISRPDAEQAHWLPNIERPTGHNDVAEPPGLIYTAGGPGSANTDLLANQVVFRELG